MIEVEGISKAESPPFSVVGHTGDSLPNIQTRLVSRQIWRSEG